MSPDGMRHDHLRVDWLALWIFYSAWCSASGWVLSGLSYLDRIGYVATLFLFFAGIFFLRAPLLLHERRRFFLLARTVYARQALPKAWLLLALLAVGGGFFYHPDNFDYLTYRFPRLLHWWWEHHWYWIQTPNDRMNLSATGMEWLMAPLFILFKTDRLFFFINLVSFLFLPGLVFSVFRHAGISGRVCWWWMWIFPAGFCFALQAGGMGNDLFAAVYLLASLHYIFLAERENRSRNLVLSCLAIALLTGAKASNIPLVALWLVVLVLHWKSLAPALRPALLIGTGCAAALVSFLPGALMNLHFTGDYTGDPANAHRVVLRNPVAGVLANSFEIAVGNLSPPVWTHDSVWPVPFGLEGYLRRNYPRFSTGAVAFEIEETAGVGLGLTALAALGLFYGLGSRLGNTQTPALSIKGAGWIAAGATLAWLGYLGKMGSEAAPRLVAAYYVAGLMILLVLFPIDGTITHRRGWKGVAYLAMVMVFPLLLLNPARPLVPTAMTETVLKVCHVPSSARAQFQRGYWVRSLRVDSLAELRKQIPATEPVIGFLGGGDDPAVSPWLPFGTREVVDVDPRRNTAADLQARQIHYVLVSDVALTTLYKVNIEDLEKDWSMMLAAKSNLILKTRRGFDLWYLLKSPPTDGRP